MPDETISATFSRTYAAFMYIVTLCAGVATAHCSGVIATAELAGGVGSGVITNSGLVFVSNGGATNGGTAAIFDSFFFMRSQVGQVFSVDQSVDPQVNLFTSRLTNGFNDLINIVERLPGGGSFGQLTSEASFFSTRPASGNGIDLTGFSIERIDMTINQLSISSPGRDLNHNGIWTDYSVQATLSFIGSPVPEPCGTAIILGGLAV